MANISSQFITSIHGNATLRKHIVKTAGTDYLNVTRTLNARAMYTGTLSPSLSRAPSVKQNVPPLHNENVSLYMFIGLFIAFVLISSFVIAVELYKSGRCKWQTRLRKKLNCSCGI